MREPFPDRRRVRADRVYLREGCSDIVRAGCIAVEQNERRTNSIERRGGADVDFDESKSSTSRYADFRVSAGNSSTLPRWTSGIHFTGLRNRGGI